MMSMNLIYSLNVQKACSNQKSGVLWNIKKIFPNVKKDKEILKFGDIEFEKNKSPIFLGM